MLILLLGYLATQAPIRVDTVVVPSGNLQLRAVVWTPEGNGPFPAVLFNHGSYVVDDPELPAQAAAIGAMFARRGYVLMFLFRQGTGLSATQGVPVGEQMRRARESGGQVARDAKQLDLLQREEMDAALAALTLLRGRPEVDPRRVGVAGHSFGGSLSLLMLARDSTLRAVISFGGAAASWGSVALRDQLKTVVRTTNAAVMFVHPENDYSTAPGKALSAEMQRAGKTHVLQMYPAFGKDAREGHSMPLTNPAIWEAHVFAFLDAHLKPVRASESAGALIRVTVAGEMQCSASALSGG